MFSDRIVDEITKKQLITCLPTDSLSTAAKKMKLAGCGSVLVAEDGKVVGIWTEADTRRLDYNDPRLGELPLARLMSQPVLSIARDASLSELDAFLGEKGIRHCLVSGQAGEPVGIVTCSDLVFSLGVEQYLSNRSVEAVSLSKLASVPASKSLAEMVEIMRISNQDGVLLTDDDDKPRAVLSERDLVRLIAEGITDGTAVDWPLRPLVQVPRSITVLDALRQLKDAKLRYLMVMDGQDRPMGFVGMKTIRRNIEIEYISQLRNHLNTSDHALEVSAQHLNLARKVIDASLNSIMITDTGGRIVSINPSFSRVTGFQANEVIGKTPSVLNSGLHDKDFYRQMWDDLASNGQWQGEIWNRRKNGEVYPEFLSITAIYDNKGRVQQYASIFNDISKQKRIEQQVHKLANYDELTGLPNRRMLHDSLVAAIADTPEESHLAALMVDIDHFSQFNESLGHLVADELLLLFARRLNQLVGPDQVVSRIGSDTFVLMVPDLGDLSMALRTVNAVSALSTEPFRLDGQEIFITTSMGIACYPEDGGNADAILKNAGTAMHKVKSMGRNGFQFYTAGMSELNQDHLDMYARLRSAIQRNEFYLHYQPKFSMMDNRLEAYEALIRWHDWKFGTVSPSTFIPMIEELGLIEEVSCWVMREACRQNLEWIELGLTPCKMAINISALHLQRGSAVQDIKQVLDDLQYPADLLELEITESAFIEHADDVSDMLNELRSLGITIAIDDFGTGYSSLSYLKKIPADTLKIDASFVRDLSDNEDDQQIIRAIIAMAHTLDLKVIAEGVETMKQARFLTRNGCDQIQGFLFCRPLAAEDVYLKNYEQNIDLAAGL